MGLLSHVLTLWLGGQVSGLLARRCFESESGLSSVAIKADLEAGQLRSTATADLRISVGASTRERCRPIRRRARAVLDDSESLMSIGVVGRGLPKLREDRFRSQRKSTFAPMGSRSL
jgi:hypothetical protein